jgi:hypothetical protein
LRNKEKAKKEKQNANVSKYISKLEQELNDDFEVPDNRIFFIHKTPRSLKYTHQSQDIRQIIYDLKFMEIYDKALYQKLVSYVEYFLKIHYKILIGKYEFDYYFPILKDIRNEILNIMKTICFNTPDKSRILYIKSIDNYVEDRIVMMQAKTYRYIKILFHKYQRDHMTYQAPFENDTTKDAHYHVF